MRDTRVEELIWSFSQVARISKVSFRVDIEKALSNDADNPDPVIFATLDRRRYNGRRYNIIRAMCISESICLLGDQSWKCRGLSW